MQLKFVTNPLIFYEAPHRILQTIKLMLEIFGDREVSLSREITKKFESVYRGKISNLLPTLESIKGEFVIVVSGFEKNLADMECGIVEQVQFYIDNGMKKMEAIKIVAREREMKKNDVYALYHQEVEK